MKYYKGNFARSFSGLDQKKLGCGAFFGCFILAFTICTVLKPYLNSLPILNLQVSLGADIKMVMTEEISEARKIDNQTKEINAHDDSHNQTKEINADDNQPKEIKAHYDSDNQTKEIKTHYDSDNQTKEINADDDSDNKTKEIKGDDDSDNQTKEMNADDDSDKKTKEMKPICDTSGPASDVCEMRGDIRIHGNSSTVFVTSTHPESINPESNSWRIRPYARKRDPTAMANVQEFKLVIVNSTSTQKIPTCTQNHSVPGLVFSTKGYVGNLFHDFTDVLIPLFLTSREFDGQVKFLATNKQSWWIEKYGELFNKLSKYEVIDIDREVGVHCFPRMVIGLKHHKEFDIEPFRSPYSMKDFRDFLRGAYSLDRQIAIKRVRHGGRKIPRLLIISRKRTRLFLNEDEIVGMAKSLGFEVVLTEADSNVAKFAKVVNSCDVMMGVHGAGLTNMVFLPQNSIVIQIVPLGGFDWLSMLDFGDPAKDMNLRYLEYKISEEESSLRQQYPPGHRVFRDPYSISKKGWMAFRAVYLDKQNVKLDVNRFRPTLLQALKLLH